MALCPLHAIRALLGDPVDLCDSQRINPSNADLANVCFRAFRSKVKVLPPGDVSIRFAGNGDRLLDWRGDFSGDCPRTGDPDSATGMVVDRHVGRMSHSVDVAAETAANWSKATQRLFNTSPLGLPVRP